MKRIMGIVLIAALLFTGGCTLQKVGIKSPEEAITTMSEKVEEFKSISQSAIGDGSVDSQEASQLLQASKSYGGYCRQALGSFSDKKKEKVKQQAIKDLTIMEETLKSAYKNAKGTESKKTIVEAQREVQGLKRSLVGFGGLGCG